MQTLQKRNFFLRPTDYAVIFSLILLNIVPVIAGIFRINQLIAGIVNPETFRFHTNPGPVIVHIVAATLYGFLGIFQFVPGFRKQFANLHQQNGKILLIAGILVAVSGLWMTLHYTFAELDGDFLFFARLSVGMFMLIFIFLGILKITQRKYIEHGQWMLRSYALALGAGTQVFTHLPWIFFPEIKNQFTRALFMTLGWVINILVAEWIIKKNKGINMKIFKILFFTVAISMATAHADDHNLTSDAIGNLIGLTNIEYSYKIASHVTLGIRGTSGKAHLGSFDLSGNSLGIVSRWYQKPALENSSLYFGATLDNENFELTTQADAIKYSANANEVIFGIGGGYHWFWESFNIGLGAYRTNREKMDLKDNQGNNYKDSFGSRLAIELTMGGKF